MGRDLYYKLFGSQFHKSLRDFILAVLLNYKKTRLNDPTPMRSNKNAINAVLCFKTRSNPCLGSQVKDEVEDLMDLDERSSSS